MKLLPGIAGLTAGGLLLTKAITRATWKQILEGQAAQVYAQSKKDSPVAGGVDPFTGPYPTLPSTGGGRLSTAQQQFAARLAKDTGLDLQVIQGWVHAEQPPTGPAPNGANNWLNIGSTGDGFFSGSNPAWEDPITAADQTAAWLAGEPVGNGTASSSSYGPPSPGIRRILSTAGQPPQVQVKAIQDSGWAGSGYPDLPAIVGEFR